MATGCALDELGTLKNASDIEFFESETDTRPISGPPARVSSSNSIVTVALGLLLFFELFILTNLTIYRPTQWARVEDGSPCCCAGSGL